MTFTGKIAVVTGGASGLGRLSAQRLAAAGATVAILDTNRQGLDETARGHARIHPYVCDVADQNAVESVLADIRQRHGAIDRLTHAAAIMPMGRLNDLSSAQIVRQMHINYDGTVFLTKAVLPEMLQRQTGEIIIFGSLTGYLPSPLMAAYSASKAATNMYAHQLIRENANSGVRIALVCPPAVNTPLIEQHQPHKTGGFIELCRKTGLIIEPGFVLDQIERDLGKGKAVIFPGMLARSANLVHRLAPELTWRALSLIDKAGY